MDKRRVCEGCRGPVTRLDTVNEALDLYDLYSIDIREVRRKLTKYYANSEFYGRLLKAIEEVSKISSL